LVRYLVGEVAAAGIPVALVDADLGQSFLGLPGSVSARTFHAPPSHEELRWAELSFLGALSPVRVSCRCSPPTPPASRCAPVSRPP
jgi:polynucleotide 5'-kinase involved in rRNA processing